LLKKNAYTIKIFLSVSTSSLSPTNFFLLNFGEIWLKIGEIWLNSSSQKIPELHIPHYKFRKFQKYFFQITRNLSISPELLARIVECPPFADSISEGDIAWLKEVGDAVAADETVGEVETDKTALPVNAPVAGVVTKV